MSVYQQPSKSWGTRIRTEKDIGMPGGEPQNKPIWAERIRDVRKRLKLNQKDLADRLKTTQSNVSKWENGEYKPSPEQFMALAELSEGHIESLQFMELGGIPASYFLDKAGKGMMPIVAAQHQIKKAESKAAIDLVASGFLDDHTGPIRHVPLLKDATAAGTPRAVDEREVEELVGLPRKWTGGGGELYLIPVEGDSMSPILESGYQALVDVSKRDMRLLERHIVLARVGDGVTIKWLRRDGEDFMLVPQHISQRHPIQLIRPGGDITVIGQVCMWIGHPPPAKRK